MNKCIGTLAVLGFALTGCSVLPPLPGPDAKIRDAASAIAIAEEVCRPEIEKLDARRKAAYQEALRRSPWSATFDLGIWFALDPLGKAYDKSGGWRARVGEDKTHACEFGVEIAASNGKPYGGCGQCIILAPSPRIGL